MPVRETATLTYRPDIDGLRGLAVLLVVAFHAFPNLKTGGFVGVDVFFVISGYLITQLVLSRLNAGTFSLVRFYQRRVRRIAPALVVVAAACCIAAWYLLLPGEWLWFGRSLAWCALFLPNVFFATTGGYFARAAGLDPLLHLWSLGVEEQFYLAWPLLILFTVRYSITKRVLAIVIAASLAISIWGGWYAPTHYFYYPDSRGWELAVGGLLGAWSLESRFRLGPSAANAVLLLGLSLIFVGGVFWTADKPIPGVWSVLPVSGAALVIGAGAGANLNRWLLRTRPIVFVGRISYPLYLWHWPLFSFTRIILGHLPTPCLALAESMVALAAAYATYRWIEHPIRYAPRARPVTFCLFAALVCLAVTGYCANTRKIPGRLTGPAVAKWDEAVREWNFPATSGAHPFYSLASLSGQGPGKTVFIGDSHLQQYWPRVESVLSSQRSSARSVLFITQTGCPALPGINILGRGHRCNDFFDYALDQALQRDVDTVVFGSFWESYFLGEFLGEKARPRVFRVADASKAILTIDSSGTALVFEQFEQVVSKLVAGGRRVFIVLSNPTSPRFDPVFPPRIRFAWNRAPLVLDSAPAVDSRPFEAYAAPVSNRLRDIAARTGAKAVDPSASLCDGFLCATTDENGLPRYIDSNHLRATAAREQASFIDETVAPDTVPASTRGLTP